MFAPSIIFQRTEAGREEIKQKSHGLTQSERLVLIMIDGVTPYGAVRNKLPSLTDQRFERAVQKLQQKDLVLEVFIPVEGQAAEEFEQEVVDRFLQQDPLDPVTIIMYDPEEELDGLLAAKTRPQAPLSPSAPPTVNPPGNLSAVAPVATPAPISVLPEIPVVEEPVTISIAIESATLVAAMDDVHNEMADSLSQEVRQRQLSRPRRTERFDPATVIAPSAIPQRAPAEHWHWGYWVMGLGFACIASFLLAKIGG